MITRLPRRSSLVGQRAKAGRLRGLNLPAIELVHFVDDLRVGAGNLFETDGRHPLGCVLLGVLDLGGRDHLHRRHQTRDATHLARRAGIPRSTVMEWLASGIENVLERRALSAACDPCPHMLNVPEIPYSYLLGLYLGDGCLSLCRRRLKNEHPQPVENCAVHHLTH